LHTEHVADPVRASHEAQLATTLATTLPTVQFHCSIVTGRPFNDRNSPNVDDTEKYSAIGRFVAVEWEVEDVFFNARDWTGTISRSARMGHLEGSFRVCET
jgi:hypothetical protein